MLDSSDVRKINMNRIRTVLWKGGEFTKLSVAQETGLSVATCNTLLNELASTGEILGEKRQLNGVGRYSIVYHINEEFESMLCVRFELVSDGTRLLRCDVLSMIGNVLYSESQNYEKMDAAVIVDAISRILNRPYHISYIAVGVSGIVDHGTIYMSDIPEMNEMPLEEKIKAITEIPVHMAYDCQFRVYGAYKKAGYRRESLSLIYALKNVLPGTASVVKGMILNGKNGFAGMTGYMSYGISKEELIKRVATTDAAKFEADVALSLISILNPDEIVCAGNVIDAAVLEEMQQICAEKLPEWILPKFRLLDDEDACYLEGMYQKVVEIKSEDNRRIRL